MLVNPWKTLEVKPGADEKTLKKQYKAKVLQYHPDTYRQYNPDLDEQHAAKELKRINMSFDYFKDNLVDGKVPGPQAVPQARRSPFQQTGMHPFFFNIMQQQPFGGMYTTTASTSASTMGYDMPGFSVTFHVRKI